MKIEDDILIRYIDGTLTEKERAEVKEWLAESPENARLLEQMYFTTEVASRLRVMKSADPDEALLHFKSAIRKKKKRLVFRHVFGILQRTAAVLFIPVFILSSYLLINRQVQGEVRILTVRTNPGVVSAFDLPDGSKVWLNADSELKYPADFQEGSRTVELLGQGYFEVVKDVEKPFVVKADKDYSVEVLGTSFNVAAYPDEDLIETTLVEGSVKLNTMSAAGKEISRMLKPNEKAEYKRSEGALEVFEVNSEYDTAWKNGEIIFRNHPMEKVLKTLERHYRMRFDVKDNQVLNSIITARFKDEQLPQVMEYLKLASGIQYTIHKPKIKDGVAELPIVEISK